jgi:ATP-dependent helicase/nuclease subunit A
MEKQGLSSTEKGTAAHLFLQYADFTKLSSHDGVLEELDRMVDEEYLTEQQAEAVKPDTITGLFSSPLGQQMLCAKELIREFKFSILTDAQDYYPDISGEQVLLQGVVDAAILEDDGLTVIDFKTDRVSGDSAIQRAEQYRGQLMTYQKALEKIFKKPVKKMVLYFLLPGKEVIL